MADDLEHQASLPVDPELPRASLVIVAADVARVAAGDARIGEHLRSWRPADSLPVGVAAMPAQVPQRRESRWGQPVVEDVPLSVERTDPPPVVDVVGARTPRLVE